DCFQLVVKAAGRDIHVQLRDLRADFDFAVGPYCYEATRASEQGSIHWDWLQTASLHLAGRSLHINGKLAELDLEHTFTLPQGRAALEERITLRNTTDHLIALTNLACGLRRSMTNDVGVILPALSSDRIVAIPFRHKATDAPEWDNDFDLSHLLTF